jgi:hypothetical protein
MQLEHKTNAHSRKQSVTAKSELSTHYENYELLLNVILHNLFSIRNNHRKSPSCLASFLSLLIIADSFKTTRMK